MTREENAALANPLSPGFQLLPDLAKGQLEHLHKLAQHCFKRLPDNPHILFERKVIDVLAIVLNPLLEVLSLSTGTLDLPKAGHARTHG
jgi:hypothetical protein